MQQIAISLELKRAFRAQRNRWPHNPKLCDSPDLSERRLSALSEVPFNIGIERIRDGRLKGLWRLQSIPELLSFLGKPSGTRSEPENLPHPAPRRYL